MTGQLDVKWLVRNRVIYVKFPYNVDLETIRLVRYKLAALLQSSPCTVVHTIIDIREVESLHPEALEISNPLGWTIMIGDDNQILKQGTNDPRTRRFYDFVTAFDFLSLLDSSINGYQITRSLMQEHQLIY
jgi:hypothetical protein